MSEQIASPSPVDGGLPALGPDSLLWNSAGDWRIYLMAPATSLLQNMLPGVSAGIEQHSKAFSEPWDRIMRSIPQIQATIYDPAMPERVRNYHAKVKGTDHNGKPYHALSPELYYAAHAIFTYTVFTVLETYDRRLSAAEKSALYEDCKVWYRRYGVSDRAMPATLPEFERYWERLTTEIMENTPVAAYLAKALGTPMEYKPPQMPAVVWKLLSPLVRDQALLLAAATLPAAARERLGLPFSRLDRLRFGVMASMIRTVWPLLPARLRVTPLARQGKRKALRGTVHA